MKLNASSADYHKLDISGRQPDHIINLIFRDFLREEGSGKAEDCGGHECPHNRSANIVFTLPRRQDVE